MCTTLLRSFGTARAGGPHYPLKPKVGLGLVSWGNNVYYAWLRTVSATGVAPLARGTARATSPTPASPRLQAAAVVAH